MNNCRKCKNCYEGFQNHLYCKIYKHTLKMSNSECNGKSFELGRGDWGARPVQLSLEVSRVNCYLVH